MSRLPLVIYLYPWLSFKECQGYDQFCSSTVLWYISWFSKIIARPSSPHITRATLQDRVSYPIKSPDLNSIECLGHNGATLNNQLNIYYNLQPATTIDNVYMKWYTLNQHPTSLWQIVCKTFCVATHAGYIYMGRHNNINFDKWMTVLSCICCSCLFL